MSGLEHDWTGVGGTCHRCGVNRAGVESTHCPGWVRKGEPDFDKVVRGFALVLEGLGVPENSHTMGTPTRAAKAWWNELCRGLTHDAPQITTFESNVDEMILLRDIPVRSLCAHHLLPFIGTAAIAYVPGNGHILGISKLSRITDYWARRPQVQEELTEQIADDIAKRVMWEAPAEDPRPDGRSAGGVAVAIRANHLCMMARGVNHSGDLVTSALRGVFRTKPEARAEFLALALNGKQP